MTQHACDCASPQQDACFLEQRREDHVLIATRRKSGKWDRIRSTSLRSCLDCHKTQAWTSVRLEGQAKSARLHREREARKTRARWWPRMLQLLFVCSRTTWKRRACAASLGSSCCSALQAARLFMLLGSSCCSALRAARLFMLLGSVKMHQNASKSWPRKCGMPSGRLVRGWTDGSICRPADVVAGT